MTHNNECMIWESYPAGDDGWRDCTCQVFNSQSDHDPLCYISEGKWGGGCNCDFIAKVRADERWATVESAVFVASQYGCDHGLLNALNAIRGDA